MMFFVTGCYEVVYQVETKGSCIKFEDAQYDQDPDEIEEDWVDACLGDDRRNRRAWQNRRGKHSVCGRHGQYQTGTNLFVY